MSTQAILSLTYLVAVLAALVIAALVIKTKYEAAGLEATNRDAAVLLVFAIPVVFLMVLVVRSDLSHIPNGTYPASDAVLAYSPGSIDPTEVAVDGKTADVDAIQVDTSLKEPLVVVKEDKVTILVPSRDYFASEAKSGQ